MEKFEFTALFEVNQILSSREISFWIIVGLFDLPPAPHILGFKFWTLFNDIFNFIGVEKWPNEKPRTNVGTPKNVDVCNVLKIELNFLSQQVLTNSKSWSNESSKS